MVHFVEINHALSLYSMLQHTGRVATPKIVPRNCLRYLQKTLGAGFGMGERDGGARLVSEIMRGITDDCP